MANKYYAPIALAVLSALTGCGGGSESGDSAPSTQEQRLITAMDGYLHNAVVFSDENGNLQWDEAEPLLGLTNENGQLTVEEDDTQSLGVMTVIQGSALSQALAAQDSQYQDISTIDTDFPGIPMNREVQFVAAAGENMLSPYTALIQMIASKQGVSSEEAAATLAQAFEDQGEALDLTQDYIQSGATKERKIAQLLTDTMGEHSDLLYQDWPSFIKEMVDAVSLLDQDQLNDPHVRPIIDGDPQTPIVINSTLNANREARSAFLTQWFEMPDISRGDAGVFFSIDLSQIPLDSGMAAMYTDPDIADSPVTYTISPKLVAESSDHLVLESGIEVRIEADGTTLTLQSDNVELVRDGWFVLSAQDRDAEGNIVMSWGTILSIDTTSANGAPSLVEQAQTNLQQTIDSQWLLEKGSAFEAQIDLTQLFADPENDPLKYRISGSILELGIVPTIEGNTLTLSGTPVKSYSEDRIRHTLKIEAKDDYNHFQPYIEVTLPEIADGLLLDSNPLVDNAWYYIESDEDNGIVKHYCRYIQFSGGKVTQTQPDVNDYHGCEAARSRTTSLTTYSEANLNTVKENVFVNSKSYTVRYSVPIEGGSAYAVTIDNYRGDANQDAYTFYTEKNEVVKRLNIDSTTAQLSYVYPLNGERVYANVEASIADNIVTVAIQTGNTCDELKQVFSSKYVMGSGFNEFDS
ncbi:hypothetical protein ACNUDM_08365 [Vibrio chaetopteri]|uniref:hypothetical protein n=1 Tax=Vibrio chaetopteri TaxID=3016528 RepID=UPI003AB679A9